ncbi:MAG: CARDB domain-containing protein [Caldilineaceae bacterium]
MSYATFTPRRVVVGAICMLFGLVFLCVALLGSSSRSIAQDLSSDWIWQNPLPQGNRLAGVGGTDASNVWAVGDNGTIIHWDGSAWSVHHSGTNVPLTAVWGTAANNMWAVGYNGTIIHWDGSTWSAQNSNTTASFTAIWGSSADDIWAVGAGTIDRWNGSSWTVQEYYPTTYVAGIWGSDANHVWAVGNGGIIYRWDGSAWSTQAIGTTALLNSVWGTDVNNVWAVGESGTILKWNGSAWNQQTSGIDSWLYSVWAYSTNEAWAVGDSGIFKWNGSAWSKQDSGAPTTIWGIWGSNASNVWAVGNLGAIMKWDGSTWSRQSNDSNEDIRGIWGTDASHIWAVGSAGTIRTWNGSSWTVFDTGTVVSLTDVWGSDPKNIWVVGATGTTFHWDGSRWSAHNIETAFSFYGVWGADANNIWAITSSGPFKWNGSTWELQTSGTIEGAWDIWGSDANNIWTVGNGGKIIKWNGSSWNTQNSGTSATLYGIWGTDANNVWAVGSSGTILKWDGSTWNVQHSLDSLWLYGIWGSDASHVWAVGMYNNKGTILKWDGNTWTVQSGRAGTWLRSAWGSDADNVWITGYGGAILRSPVVAPTSTSTITPSSTPTSTATPSSTPTPTNTPTSRSTPTPTGTFTPTGAPTLAPTPTSTPVPVWQDNFNDNVTDQQFWQVQQIGPGVGTTESHNRLEIAFAANASNDPNLGFFGAGYWQRCQVSGDFDASVSYDLVNWPPTSGVRLGLVVDIDTAPQSVVGVVERYNYGGGSSGETYGTDGTGFGGLGGEVTTAHTNGRLRLVRQGSVLYAYYAEGQTWIPLRTGSIDTANMYLSIWAWSHDAYFGHHAALVAFDDFYLYKGSLVCPQETSTPTSTPTPTGTPLPGSPQLTAISPDRSYSDTPGDVALYGFNFRPGITINVGGQVLQSVQWVSATEVRGVVPAGLPSGVYDVSAQNPGSESESTLTAAYTVLDPAGDDFFAAVEDLWSDPPTLRQGETVELGLNVHRQGGKATEQVTVAFYQVVNGVRQEIGRTLSAPIAPGAESVETVVVPWNTVGLLGKMEVEAVIDPYGTVSEATRRNNSLTRTMLVLPPSADTFAPTVDSLLVNNGATETSSPVVTATIQASDTGGSGVAAMYLIEREFNSAARQWVAVQQTGWIPFQNSHPLTLTSRGGTRYIQAWVSDGAGNVSIAVIKTRINFVPPSDSLQAGQVRIYRRTLGLGEHLGVTLETLSGDADLYIWRPDGNQSWVRNLGGTATDAVGFDAPVAGEYQVEVYGYTASTYHLAINAGAAAAAESESQAITTAKPLRTQPIVPPTSEPPGTVAVPAAPVGGLPDDTHKLFLPALRR